VLSIEAERYYQNIGNQQRGIFQPLNVSLSLEISGTDSFILLKLAP
jgi:hypothetical protein